jgi:ABC-2 type transport system permease protein
MGALMIFMVILTPAMQGMNLVDLFASMPPTVLAAFGMGDGSQEALDAIATPEGIIAFGFFGKMALIFAAYPVVMGLRATSRDEADGNLDVTLSLPVSRSRVIIESWLAYAIDIVILVLFMIGGLFLGVAVTGVELDVAKMSVLVLNLIPVLWLVLSATVFVGALISKRQTVVAIMTIFIVASFIIQTVGAMVTAGWMDIVEAFSFFTYYNVQHLLADGVVMTNVLILLVVAVALVAGSVYTFQRRDIAV